MTTSCTTNQLEVLRLMRTAGGGWYPLNSTWVVGDNQTTHRLCRELAQLGFVECVGGDPEGAFVCDWRLTRAGLAEVQAL